MEETTKIATTGFASDLDRLKARTRELKNSVSQQLSNLSTDTNQALKVGLLIAGVAVGAWIVIKLTSRGGKQVVVSNGAALVPTRSSFPIVDTIRNAIAAFLLGIARDRIISFLERMNQPTDESTSRTSATSAE